MGVSTYSQGNKERDATVMKTSILSLAALLVLGGCVSEAQINAELSRHIGQSETQLVREMGVPNRHYSTGGHTFLAYIKGYQSTNAYSTGFGYPFGFGWGGYGYGYGWGGPIDYSADTVPYYCETDFDIVQERVVGFARHGNGC